MRFQVLDTGYCLAQERLLLRGGQRGKKIRCPARVGVFAHPRGVVLFDTGYAVPALFDAAAHFPYTLYLRATPVHSRPEQSAAAQLRQQGIAPESVPLVIVSHFHADHIAGLADFPRARFVATAEGYADIQGRRGWGALRRAFLPALLPTDFHERATLLETFEGAPLPPFGPTHDLFGDGLLRLVRLPGHARGQLGLVAQTSTGTVFWVADAAYSRRAIRENRPPHGITGLFVDDPAAVRTTLAQLHTFAAQNPSVRLYPTHDPEPEP